MRYSTQLGGLRLGAPGGGIRAQLLSPHTSVENSRGDGRGRGQAVTMESATEGEGVRGLSGGREDGRTGLKGSRDRGGGVEVHPEA